MPELPSSRDGRYQIRYTLLLHVDQISSSQQIAGSLHKDLWKKP